ncbi:MAG: DNA polymerase III subunit delta [Bacteroidales bacterium]|nr:DNA polymerase III subunit delta [Bacteroidales bacterium]
MKYEEIIRNIERKIFAPVYFFHGEEPWYIDQLTDLLENNVLDESLRDFNQTVAYGYDLSAREIVDMARQFPMMGNFQVVIIKEAQELKSWDEIENYLDNPLSTTILVLAHKHKKVDKRKTFYKKINTSKNAVVFESAKLKEAKVPEFIRELIRQKGYDMQSGALLLLSEYLGNDLSKINNELQKLIISIPKGSMISEDDIEQNIGISKDYNIFELQKALTQRDALKAQRMVNYFESNPKENPLQMLTVMLHNYFIKVFLYSHLHGQPQNVIASELGIPPFIVSEYAAAARVFPPNKVKKILAGIRLLDLKSKGVDSTDASGYNDLRVLIFQMIN